MASTLADASSLISQVLLIEDYQDTEPQKESTDAAIRMGFERRLREWAVGNRSALVNEKRLCRVCAARRQVGDLASNLLFHFISLHSDSLREVLFPSISLAPSASKSAAVPVTQIRFVINRIEKPTDDSEQTWPPVKYVDIYEVPLPNYSKTAELLQEADAFLVCIQAPPKHQKRYRCGLFLTFLFNFLCPIDLNAMLFYFLDVVALFLLLFTPS